MSVVRAGNVASRLSIGQLSFRGVKRVCNTNRLRQFSSSCNQTEFETQVTSCVGNHYLLTKEEALSFITKTLKIPQEQIYCVSERLSLLNNIIIQMKRVVPFTNIPILIADKKSVDYPHCVLKKCKQDILCRLGGQCYWINSFMKHLLSMIGFNTDFIGAGNRAQSLVFDLHQGVIARDVSHPGSIHLVEAGLPHPLFEAVPLDFADHSPSYIYGKSMSKFFNCGRGIFKYCMLYEKDYLEPWDDTIVSRGETWKVEKEYRIAQVKPFGHFTKIAEHFVSNISLLPRIYQQFLIVGYPKGNFVSIDKYKVTTMNQTGGYYVTHISSSQELIETVRNYFPQISEETVVKAIKNIHRNSAK